MRGDGVAVALGMLDGEAVAAGIMKAEGAILGLFQETGLRDPQSVVHSENQWRHHGYHAFPGVYAQAASAAAVRGGLLIALRADVFAAEDVRDVADIVAGKAMALDVVTAGGTLTVINVHGPGSGGDSWGSKASFWAAAAMYAAAKSAGGTRAVLLGGDFNVWLESPGHSTTRRFQALWEQCGFHRAGAAAEEDRRPTRARHRLDSFLLNSPLVPWAVRERPHLAPGRSHASLGSDPGPVVLNIPLAVAGKERFTRMAYSHAQGRLHAIRPESPGFVRRRRRSCRRPARIGRCGSGSRQTRTLPPWARRRCKRSSTCSTPSAMTCPGVTGVRMTSGMDPQYPYGQAETEASLAQVLSDQQALAWRAHELWQRDAATAGLRSQEAAALLRHLRQVDPGLSPATVEKPARCIGPAAPIARDSRGGAAGCPQEQQAQAHKGLLAEQSAGPAAPMDGDTGGHQRGELCPVRPVVRTPLGVGEGAHGGFGRHWRGPRVLGGFDRQEASEPAGLRAAGPGPHSSGGAGGMEVGAGLHPAGPQRRR